ncbi:MAG: hypothetical protein ACYC5R_14315 [Melioribacteraceae bacterium]
MGKEKQLTTAAGILVGDNQTSLSAGKLYSVAEKYEKHAWLLKSLFEKK